MGRHIAYIKENKASWRNSRGFAFCTEYFDRDCQISTKHRIAENTRIFLEIEKIKAYNLTVFL